LTMLTLSRSDILASVSMQDALEAAREAFLALSGAEAACLVRQHLELSGADLLVMPASTVTAASIKVVTVRRDGPASSLPTVQAAVLLVDGESGAPMALLEGSSLTSMRTGAAIGLGADLLALPDACVVALFGVGATARTSLQAVCAVRPVREVRAVHPHPERF